MQVGSYSRISYGDDERLGIQRQEHDNCSLIKLRGWEYAKSYIDKNLSAYKSDVVRPAFEQMLDDLQARRIDGIVCWDLDRLARQPTDLERLLKIYDSTNGLVFATVQGDLQLATSDGRTLARVMVAFANKASADTARRVARKKLEKAMAGVGFSNYRPFGWCDNRIDLLEPEAGILRQAAADVLSGQGLFVICSRLNKRGIRTVRGNIWKTHAMRRVLTAPRMAGFAVYQNELLLDISGQPVKGKWQPIFDEPTWRAVCEALSHKRKQKQRGNSGLLTNIARCGKCGCGMVITRRPRITLYVCRSTDSGGCGGVGVSAPHLEEQVLTLLFTYLDKKIELQTGWDSQARLDEVSNKLGELMEQYREGLLTGALVFPMLRILEEEQAELLVEQVAFTRQQVRKSITVKGEWDELDLHAKRAVIQSVIEAVVVKPVGRGVNRYDPNRVDVVPLQLLPRYAPSAPV